MKEGGELLRVLFSFFLLYERVVISTLLTLLYSILPFGKVGDLYGGRVG